MKIVLDITAKNKLDTLNLESSELKPRIVFSDYGWLGSGFGLSLDKKNEDDTEVIIDGYPFLIDPILEASLNNVFIKYNSSGFITGFIVSNNS